MQLFAVRRRVRFPWRWFVIACLAMLLSGAKPASAAPILSVVPSSTNVTAGGIFTLDFAIEQVVDLYAFQFGISFNPDVLTAFEVTEGSFVTGNFVEGLIDNDLGMIFFTANALSGPVAGISGDGTLLSVTFGALAVGSSSISIIFDSFQLDDLLDSNLASMLIDPVTGEYVPPSVLNGTVTVSAVPPSQPVPEPSSMALLAIGVATSTIAVRRRRRQSSFDRIQ